MGAMLGAVSAGTDLAHDIETGVLTRLALTPMRRTAILLGQLAGALVMAVRAIDRVPPGRGPQRRDDRQRRRAARSC